MQAQTYFLRSNIMTFEALLQSYKHLITLKKLKRTGWLCSGVALGDCESVAEHSLGTGFLGFLIACEFYPELNAEKVMLLGFIHDLGEAVTGDVLPWDKVQIQDFDEQERAGALQTAVGLKALPKLTELYDEYYASQTPEAKLVRQVDKLEMLLQAYCYEKELGLDLQPFFDNHPPKSFDDILQPLITFLICGREGAA